MSFVDGLPGCTLTADEAIRLLGTIGQVLGILLWPAVLLFFLIRFQGSISELIAGLGQALKSARQLKVQALGVEATISLQREEAAAALGAAVGMRGDRDTAASSALRDVTGALPAPQAQSRLQGSRVLWVDDNPENNHFERQALEALGVRVDISTSTEDAMKALPRNSYDLIISDMTRDADPRAGYTLLDQLRKQGDRTPFIIYAGTSSPEKTAEARSRGALDYLSQPAQLFRLVSQALITRPRAAGRLS